MAESPDFAKIPVKCPKCQRRSEYKVGRLRHNGKVKCPTCWQSFEVDTARIDEGVCGPRYAYGLNLLATGAFDRF